MFGKRVKEIRKKRGMSQKALAEKVGISEGQISNIESGKRSTTVERQADIAKALHVSLSDLYADDYKMKVDESWVMFNERMKEKGITPEQAEKWIRIAEQIIKDSK